MTSAYPLQWPEGWPRTPRHERIVTTRFKGSFITNLGNILREVRMLGGTQPVISTNLPLRKRDGLPYSDDATTQIDDPGIAVYFMREGKQTVMARDAFTTVHDNAASLRLAIEAMRALERHGGGDMMDRAFAGFQQLPPPGGSNAEVLDWRAVFAPLPAGLEKPDLLLIVESRFRKLAQEAHPDRGGSQERMIRLNAALAKAREDLR